MVHASSDVSIRNLTLFGLFLLAFPVLAPDSAGAGDVFLVRDVAVDETAQAAVEARDLALANGQKEAFRRLLERLILKSDAERLPELSADEIADLVRGIEVREEKTSSVRYLAKLSFRFKPAAVRRLLRSSAIPFAETASKPVLVIPVYQIAGASLLWDDPNPWRTAWSERPRRDSLVPLIVPPGDLADVAEIGPNQAMAADQERLEAIATRYGVSDSLVTAATLIMDPVRNQPSLDVSVSRFGSPIHDYTTVFSLTGVSGETVDHLLRAAVAEVVTRVEENWKRDNLMQFDRSPESLEVSVPLKGLPEWVEIRRRLDAIAIIRERRILYLSRSEVRLDLHFVGSKEQLKLALAQSDLDLSHGGTSWILHLSDGRGEGG